MSLICSKCGKKVETLPLQCGISITMNYETNKWECDMGNCGTISFDQFLCENCCINESIMKIYNDYEALSLENMEFHEELKQLKNTIVQTKLSNPDFTYWVKFGDGDFKFGKGEIDGASIHISCPQKIMTKILMGNASVFSEFLSGNLSVEGDLQYVVVYFDLLNLASEINKEMVRVYNE